MTDQHFYIARIDASGAPEAQADRERVPWWSFTKTVLAAAALKLVAQGSCGLDDRIDGHPYTLRQLLQHRAGVPNYGGLRSYHDAVLRGDIPWTVDELLVRVQADRLDFEPGQGWRYSNVGYLHVRQLIERIVGCDIGIALRILLFDPLGLDSVRLAANPQDLDDTVWANAAQYHPGWVYHGLLIGTPGAAVRLLHELLVGTLLPANLLAEMSTPHPLGDLPLPGRPWQATGYGLGLMIGRMEGAGIAVGHSGGGPTSVSAVYHFADLPIPCTVAAFAEGQDEGAAEFEAVRLALPA
jgi:CubicO group peptidase (beta-lactamase class C family)